MRGDCSTAASGGGIVCSKGTNDTLAGGSLPAAVQPARLIGGRRLRSRTLVRGCGGSDVVGGGGGGDSSGGSRGCCDGGGGGDGGNDGDDHVWYADEHPLLIPVVQRQEELLRRKEAKRRLEEYRKLRLEHLERQRRGEGGQPPVPQKVKQPRIWWTESDVAYEQGIWKATIDNEEIRIDDWRTKNLKGDTLEAARARPRNSVIQGLSDRGHKILQAGTVYVRRTHRVGYSVFAKRDLAQGEIVAAYVGKRYGCDVLDRHITARDCGTHKISLRHRASMPIYFTGINGEVINNLESEGGSRRNLQYYRKNGFGSLLNSDRERKCNCKVEVEYTNYTDQSKEFHVDDEYCPSEVPQDCRVIPSLNVFSLDAQLTM